MCDWGKKYKCVSLLFLAAVIFFRDLSDLVALFGQVSEKRNRVWMKTQVEDLPFIVKFGNREICMRIFVWRGLAPL